MAIPREFRSISGIMLPAIPPRRVPEDQHTKGSEISPYIYAGVMSLPFPEAAAKISSVIPKEARNLCGRVKLLSSLCDKERLISEYRIFMISCARAISSRVPAAEIMVRPATCPAEVRFVIEIIVAASQEIPLETADIPKLKDTDRYPKPMGIPSLHLP